MSCGIRDGGRNDTVPKPNDDTNLACRTPVEPPNVSYDHWASLLPEYSQLTELSIVELHFACARTGCKPRVAKPACIHQYSLSFSVLDTLLRRWPNRQTLSGSVPSFEALNNTEAYA